MLVFLFLVLLTPVTQGVPASCPIVSMMKDRYANYVVGRILNHDEREMPEVKVVRRLIEDNVEASIFSVVRQLIGMNLKFCWFHLSSCSRFAWKCS